MRLCRVCLCDESNNLFKEFTDICVSNLNFVCGISVQHSTSLICSTCEVDLTNAAKLKKIALVADEFFQRQIDGAEIEDAALVEEEIIEEKLEYDTYEMIEYDDTIEDEVHEVKACTRKPPTMKANIVRQSKTQKQIHQCDVCLLIFSSTQRLRNHIRVKHEDVPESELLPCVICDKKFKIQEYLDLHVRHQHNSNQTRSRQKAPCSKCGKILSSFVALRNHEEKHLLDSLAIPMEQIKKFFCDFCGSGFRMKSYLFNHMHNVHIRKKHQCNLCDRGFYKKGELEDHTRQYHTLETPFECEYEGCTKRFARKKNYLIHKRIHTNDRPYKCTQCEKAFIHFIDRKRHMMKHTGERPHACQVCSKGFMRKTELEVHMRSH